MQVKSRVETKFKENNEIRKEREEKKIANIKSLKTRLYIVTSLLHIHAYIHNIFSFNFYFQTKHF